MVKIKKALDDSTAPMGLKTLVQEDGGRSIKSDIVKSNPFPTKEGCGRAGCMMCILEPSKGRCWVSNIVYNITCNRSPCTEEPALPTYVGESCRSGFVRGGQHLSLYKGRKDNSFLWKHSKEKHLGVIGDRDYKMTLAERCRGPLPRVLTEAVLIQQNESSSKTENLNSKMEYFRPEYVRSSFSKGPADL